MFLLGIERRGDFAHTAAFPWSPPLFGGMTQLEFRAPVTFLVGENGCGKSTLLEGLAVGVAAIADASARSTRLAQGPGRSGLPVRDRYAFADSDGTP